MPRCVLISGTLQRQSSCQYKDQNTIPEMRRQVGGFDVVKPFLLCVPFQISFPNFLNVLPNLHSTMGDHSSPPLTPPLLKLTTLLVRRSQGTGQKRGLYGVNTALEKVENAGIEGRIETVAQGPRTPAHQRQTCVPCHGKWKKQKPMALGTARRDAVCTLASNGLSLLKNSRHYIFISWI